MENLFGRTVIYTSSHDLNINSVVKIVNGAILRHEENSRQIEYLERYFTGKQPILGRNKVIRPDVNNKLVINNAYSIVRNVNGYFLGEPIKYASKYEDNRTEVELLNNMIDSIDKACGDTQLGEWQSICGTAYRLICVSENAESQDKELAPFSISLINLIPGVKINKLSELSIPKLSKGALVTDSIIANIGEGKDEEAVIPLNDQVFKKLAQGINKNNADSNSTISEESLYRAFLRALEDAPEKTATFVATLNNKVIAKEVLKEQQNADRRFNPVRG